MGNFESYRDESKVNYGNKNGEPATLDTVNCGSLQRIADATELMAKNFHQLENDRAMYKRWYEQEKAEVKRLAKVNAGLKGVITKLKKK